MADLDDLAPNYRRAQQRWPDGPTLEKCYEALNACFAGNAHGLVEHVKSFIESVCVTIMGELREPMPSSTPSTTDLLVAALNPLGLRNSKGANKLDKVLSAFSRLADALTDMRNAAGPVAHGKDAFLDAVTSDHARAFLHAGDAILGVLLNAFEGKQPDLIATREPYESFPHLNERIDRAVRVSVGMDEDGELPLVLFCVTTGPPNEAIELRVEPSRLLYGIDREAYIEVLKIAESVAVKRDVEIPTEGVSKRSKVADVPFVAVAASSGPTTKLASSYDGALTTLRTGVGDFLIAEGLDPQAKNVDGFRLVDSLLATVEQNAGLDWKEREPMQARLKIASKRALVQFGVGSEKADVVAGRLVGWLRVQMPNVGTDGTSQRSPATGVSQ